MLNESERYRVTTRGLNVSEVLEVLKEHIGGQNARQQENNQRQKEMHEECLAVMKGFLEVFKDMKKQ